MPGWSTKSLSSTRHLGQFLGPHAVELLFVNNSPKYVIHLKFNCISPEHLSAEPATASGVAPAQSDGPSVVAKASYLRPILVLKPVLCLVPRSPPSSRSRLLKKLGAAEFRLPAPQRRGEFKVYLFMQLLLLKTC